MKYLDRFSDKEVLDLNMPTGIPLVYELEDDLAPIRRFYLGDAEKLARTTATGGRAVGEKALGLAAADIRDRGFGVFPHPPTLVAQAFEKR